jgi:hypothetical protein
VRIVVVGRVLSVLPVLVMVFGATTKLTHAPQFTERWTSTLGYPENTAIAIGLLELACVVLLFSQ